MQRAEEEEEEREREKKEKPNSSERARYFFKSSSLRVDLQNDGGNEVRGEKKDDDEKIAKERTEQHTDLARSLACRSPSWFRIIRDILSKIAPILVQ
jgi:hypothetical protein